MNSKLKEIMNNLSGNVIVIGLNDEYSKIIYKNNNVLNCDELNYYKRSSKGNASSNESIKYKKTINIKKIRKIYKKKSVDYIICNYSDISKFMNTFVKDSVHINKKKLYFFGNVDVDFILKKYKRYNTKINTYNYKDGIIIEIDNSNAKNNILKEVFYKIIDSILTAVDVIGNILMG